ncbi:UDP-3-O-(3-hydroxymyristoyl)glucosamine N-acyltransferase [Roseomonas sp. GC11]|uniref:UDP-3-O-(3-hydroxymyristoyl)glucosamine N-acyltransferase n=1 Tax=Roseomonas sp. GC11 TaxID=2950546 RepID=UPI00210E90E6|nr:UDP-3-O-(3-hydroxymyristoyl)glucosamine N-acyltransferase [Roseomonas sp. GC11]MCQ4160159.1 UDP-3-O-(3-hydroxymyristoyl)glucosamine N-acyltransferase [Roseomonas sp. GC11]
MADPRFHPASGPHPLSRVAEVAGAERTGARLEEEGARLFEGVASLAEAGPAHLAFLEGRRHLPALRASRAGAVLLRAEFAAEVPRGCVALVVAAPQLAFARVAGLFHPAAAPQPGIHPTAQVAPGAVIGPGSEIGPYAVIGAGAVLGARAYVGPHAFIGPGCVFGDDARIHAHASAICCLAGHRVTLHHGARVGQEGFGFVPTPEGRFLTIPQLGRVVLEDEVEIGANSCVDRGALGDTVLGRGTRLDNLVQIGHNVTTGRGCVIVAQVGISGSTRLGDYVTIAGQAGLTGHLDIGSRARIGAQAGVQADIPPGQDVTGSPAMPVKDALRAALYLRKVGARKASVGTTPAGTAPAGTARGEAAELGAAAAGGAEQDRAQDGRPSQTD